MDIERLEAERQALQQRWNKLVESTSERGKATPGDMDEHRSLRQQLDRVDAQLASALHAEGYRAQRAEVDADLDVADRTAWRKRRGVDVRRPSWLLPDTPADTGERVSLMDPELRRFDVPLGKMFAAKRNQRDGRIVTPETRDLYTTTTSAPVPTELYSRMFERLIQTSAVLSTNVLVVSTDGGYSLQMPRIDTYGTAAITAQGTAVAELDPTFGTTTLGAFAYKGIVQASTELMQDTPFALEPYVADSLARSIDQALGSHLAVGTGTTQPRGLFRQAAGTTHQGGTGVSGQPTADDLIRTYFALPRQYRPDAEWVMADTNMSVVARMKSTTNEYLLQPALAEGYPDRLLGRPVRTDSYCPAFATAGTGIMFGDWSRAAVLRFGGPVNVERSDQFAFNQFLATWRCIARVDLQQLDSTASAAFVGGTA